MARRRPPGRFFTFEGIDGSGKSTQLDLLARYLDRLRVSYVVTREPGGTRLGERIREILLSDASADIDPRTELLLMFASRAQNVTQVIRPALARGQIVLCDRFTDASLAYQGYGRGLDLAFIRRLDRFACQGVHPHMTFVLDINPHTSVRRARRRNLITRRDESRFEGQARAFYERVRSGYAALARREPRRIRLVPGEDAAENIHQRILDHLRPLLAPRLRRQR